MKLANAVVLIGGFYLLPLALNYDTDALLGVCDAGIRSSSEDSQVHGLTLAAHVDGKLHDNIIPAVPVFINETTSHALSDVFLRCPAT